MSTNQRLRIIYRILVATLVAILLAAVGGLAAWWLGAFLIDMRLIKPDGNIDDDAAIINMGIAFIGTATGFVTGFLVGWRLASRATPG